MKSMILIFVSLCTFSSLSQAKQGAPSIDGYALVCKYEILQNSRLEVQNIFHQNFRPRAQSGVILEFSLPESIGLSFKAEYVEGRTSGILLTEGDGQGEFRLESLKQRWNDYRPNLLKASFKANGSRFVSIECWTKKGNE